MICQHGSEKAGSRHRGTSKPSVNKKARRTRPASLKMSLNSRPAGPSEVRADQEICALEDAQIVSRRLAGPAVGNDVERHLLAFVQAAEARTLDRADVNEHIR